MDRFGLGIGFMKISSLEGRICFPPGRAFTALDETSPLDIGIDQHPSILGVKDNCDDRGLRGPRRSWNPLCFIMKI